MSIGLFADQEFYLPGDAMPPPHTAVGLLMDLKLIAAPFDVQQAAITEWLVENEPSDALAADLRRRNFTV